MTSQGKKPSAKEIAAKFRTDIAEGVHGPGAKLPGAQAYAKKLGVALMTVQGAYAQLVSDGLVEGRPGSGTYVIDPAQGETTPQQAAANLRNLQNQLKHVASQVADLAERVAKLEGDEPSAASHADK